MYRYISGTLTSIPEATISAGQFTSVGVNVTTYGAGTFNAGYYLYDSIQNEARKILYSTKNGFVIESAFTSDVVVAQNIYIINMGTIDVTIYNNGDDTANINNQHLPPYAPTILKLTTSSPIIVDALATQLLVTETTV